MVFAKPLGATHHAVEAQLAHVLAGQTVHRSHVPSYAQVLLAPHEKLQEQVTVTSANVNGLKNRLDDVQRRLEDLERQQAGGDHLI